MTDAPTLNDLQAENCLRALMERFPNQRLTDTQKADYLVFFKTLYVGEWPQLMPAINEYSGLECGGNRPDPQPLYKLRDGIRAIARREREAEQRESEIERTQKLSERANVRLPRSHALARLAECRATLASLPGGAR